MSDRVPTQFVRSLLKMAGEKGYDFSTILTDSGVDFDPFDESSSAYRAEVSAMQYSRVYQHVLLLLQDETFGTKNVGTVTPGGFRMMCYCILSCENLGQAITRASEFYRTFFEERGQLYANFTEQYARVGYCRVDNAGNRVAAADAYGLSMWHRFFFFFCGRVIDLKRVDFPGSAPHKLEKYEALFGCPLNFNQPNDLLYFNSECLAWPVVHTEHSLREFLRTAPYQLLIMEKDTSGNNLSAQVKAMIGHDFSEGFPSFEAISTALNVSAPTLRRRLKREGTTFQQLKDNCRRDAAMLYLDRPEKTINEVAFQLGFTDPSAFHRSFKKWMGQTPGQYRARLSADQARPS